MFVERPMKTYKRNKSSSQNKLAQYITSKNTRKQNRKMKDNTCDQEELMNNFCKLPVPDIIDYNLNVLFVGLFSGKKSIKEGHHYSSSNNHFYHALYKSGMTNGDKLTYSDDKRLAQDYKIGIVTLASRPKHRSKTKLSVEEIRQGFPNLLEKIEKYRPKILCFNGRVVFQAFAIFQNAWIHSSTKEKIVDEYWEQPNFSIRWSDHTGCTKVFYVTSTSGRVAQYKKQNNIKYFKKLKELVDNNKADKGSNEETIKYKGQHTKVSEEDIDLIDYVKEKFNNGQEDYEDNDVKDSLPNKKRKREIYSPPKSFMAKRW